MEHSVRINAGQVRDVDSMRRLFLTAVLLTGSVQQAEDAVLDAINLIDMEQGTPEALLKRTVVAAINKRSANPQSPEDAKSRSSMLPWELLSVIYLSPRLRHCFVLRILHGWSREISASLLGVEASQIDEQTRAAVVRLRYIHEVFCAAANRLSTPQPTNGFGFRSDGPTRRMSRESGSATTCSESSIVKDSPELPIWNAPQRQDAARQPGDCEHERQRPLGRTQ